ncbi:hypothetical protein DXG01_016798 [Tephrocybe rancida]|nr:hypothetical protein DXG01_016798 [Tephrocybe rancida]
METILDLLAHRGAIYSDRPFFVVACELMGMIRSTALLPFGPRWKFHRKLFRMALSPEKIKRYEGSLSHITNLLADGLRQDPSAFVDLARL